MYDAIVIGARCAGAPTAMLLARQGHSVLLVDRAEFPSDTMSTHMVQTQALVRLRSWGLLDRLWETGCPELKSVEMDFGEVNLEGDPPLDFGHVTLKGSPTPLEGMSSFCAPRRVKLDAMLVDAAVESGVELRQQTSLVELTRDGDRVTGARLSSKDAGETVEEAKIVIGADGLNSSVAKAVGAEVYNEVPSLTVGYYAYFSGVADTAFRLTPHPGRNVAEFPTHDDQVCINVSWPVDRFHEVREDIEGNFHSSIAEYAPGLAERMADAQQEERFKGTAVVPNFYRKPFGDGWALVGDAGYHKDPIGAHGIMDAFRDAELLSDAVHAGLAGERPVEEALAEYQTTRDTVGAPLFGLDVQLAALNPARPVLALLGALVKAGNPDDVAMFLGVLAGTVEVTDLFAPENISRVLEEADVPMSALAPA